MQDFVQTINSFIDSKRDEIIETWKEVVNIESFKNDKEGVNSVCARFTELFEAEGFVCKTIDVGPNSGDVLVGVLGADRPGKPVIFGGHMDTVHPVGTFGENPFRIEDGKAYGPGVLDMKGGIIITLYVIKALEAAGYKDRPIRICFCGDEEAGKFHAYACEQFQKWADGCIAGFNMETGPVNNDLCTGRKWAMWGHLDVHGVSAHSGNNYTAGRNALVEAAYKILAIQNCNDMEKGTNMNPAVIKGGTVPNAIPDAVSLDFSGRFLYLAEAERVKNELTRIFQTPDVDGTSIDFTIGEPGGGFEDTKENHELLDFINTVCEKEGYPAVGGIVLGGGSDAGNIAMMGVPVLCSCGVRGEWNHTDREYAVVESMYERTELWCMVVAALDQFKK